MSFFLSANWKLQKDIKTWGFLTLSFWLFTKILQTIQKHMFFPVVWHCKMSQKIKKSHNLLFDYYKFMLRILIKCYYFPVKRIMWNSWKGIAHLHKNVFFWWWSAVCWHCLFKSLSKIHLFSCVWAANNSVNVDYWRTFFTHPSKRFEFVYFSFFHLGNSTGVFMCFFVKIKKIIKRSRKNKQTWIDVWMATLTFYWKTQCFLMIFCIFLDCFFIKSIHYIRALKHSDF